MGIDYEFFIGPYAQWYSPEPTGEDTQWEWPLFKSLVDGGTFDIQNNMGEFPQFTRRGRECWRYTLMPRRVTVHGVGACTGMSEGGCAPVLAA